MEKCIKIMAIAVCIISAFCATKKVIKATKATLKAIKAIKLYKTEISN